MGNLRDERIMRELSQRELGEVIGKDQKYISGVELGRIIPGFRNADTLARFLGVPVYENAMRELTTKEAQNDG